jgi:hypothetical protein
MFASLMLLAIPSVVIAAVEWADLSFASTGAIPEHSDPYVRFIIIMFSIVYVIMLAVGVRVGVLLAPAVGLKAPVITALLTGKDQVEAALKPQIIPALLVGLFNGLMRAVCIWHLRQAMPHLVERSQDAPGLSIFARVLMEPSDELMMRWGGMTFFVWLVWKVVQGGKGELRAGVAWLGNIMVAVLCAAFQLRVAFIHGVNTPLWSVILVSVNIVFALGCGWLFWRKGLEASMLSRIIGVLCTVAALYIMSHVPAEIAWYRSQEALELIPDPLK